MSSRERWLLGQLLQARGEVVGHEALSGMFFDDVTAGPSSLYRTVQLLREALGDRSRTVVVAVNGEGYRIGLPVAVIEAAPSGREGRRRQGTFSLLEADAARLLAHEKPSATSLAALAQRLRCAIEGEPSNVVAASAYADVLITQMVRGYVRPSSQSDDAFYFLDRALAANPDHPPALAAKGWLCGTLHRDNHAGLRLIERTRRLSPQCPRIAFLSAWLLIAERRLEEASLELDRTVGRSPLHIGLHWLRAWLLCARRKYGTARSAVDKGLEIAPECDLLWVCDAIARVRLGERKSARNSIRKALQLSPGDWLIRANVGWVRAATGGKFGYGHMLSSVTSQPEGYASPVMSAIVQHAIGERAAAAEFLRIAFRDRDPWSLLAWCDPRLQD